MGCGQECCTVHKVYTECGVWAGVLYCTWSVGCRQKYCVVHGVWDVGRSIVLYMECGV